MIPSIFAKNSYKYLLLFLLGALSFFAHAPFGIFPLLALGYSLLFIFLMQYTPTLRAAFFMGQSYGFGYFLGGLYWIGNALLIEPEQFLIFTPLAYLGLPFALGIFYSLAGIILFLVKNYYKPSPFALGEALLH